LADITQPRYSQLLKRVFGIKGANPGIVINPGIAATHDVADPYQPENRFLRGERSFGVVDTVTNTAATNFGYRVYTNPPNSNRVAVIRRITWSLNVPTAANQPGALVHAGVRFATASAAAPTIFAIPKDTRVGLISANSLLATGLVSQLAGILGPANSSVFTVQVFPGAAAQPLIVQADNLDLVVSPGTGYPIVFASDALPVATYQWLVCVEGFERNLDPAEQLSGT